MGLSQLLVATLCTVASQDPSELFLSIFRLTITKPSKSVTVRIICNKKSVPTYDCGRKVKFKN